MEDNRIFFVGLAVLILGLLIMVYDLPQVMYIHTITTEEMQLHDNIEMEMLQRIQNEFYVGVGILAAGAVLMLMSRFPPAAFAK